MRLRKHTQKLSIFDDNEPTEQAKDQLQCLNTQSARSVNERTSQSASKPASKRTNQAKPGQASQPTKRPVSAKSAIKTNVQKDYNGIHTCEWYVYDY